jgi:hypothetical protein
MQFINLSLRILPLSTLLNQLWNDGHETEEVDDMAGWFAQEWGGGRRRDMSLVSVSGVVSCLSPEDEGVWSVLYNLLIATEKEGPAFIDIGN